jgi:hypothetical protein
MCISATTSFVAAGAIAAAGLATLRHVDHPRSVLLATIPLLFALQQFTEGFVWLGLEGAIGALALQHSTFLFMLYAQGILPFLMPLAVLLIEPRGLRFYGILICTLLGAGLGAYMIYAIVGFPSTSFVERRSIVYHNELTDKLWVAAAYEIATCGALVLSTHRVVRWLGLLNIVGLTIVLITKAYAFTSVWCLYAAILSVMLYWQFARAQIDVERPNRSVLAT